MNILLQYYFLIEAISTDVDDPLIDWQSENLLKILVFIFIFGVAFAINILSSKVEHAILFAFVCTIISVAFFIIK
ncbi:hypothetical protein I8748_12340 [Nostoc sp. CENA67]|uniref:Uncharacterized protein n=1 Tax=Amazonocrinis nigriterrae CENA67 TaxID=2794033 RepID=A0A8J7HNL9_9NOST|nr:hypothetical protein [Amazonocrinis nigriterrae]MBH8562961.1 hypothetical protein [Amazonocrinis nigriterrae CENA67]